MRFKREVSLPCSASEAFDWHARGGAFGLVPPWITWKSFRVRTGLEENSTIRLQLRKLGFRKEWVALSERLEGLQGCSIKGFAKWGTTRSKERMLQRVSNRRNRVRIARRILGELVCWGHVHPLERTFWYRHEITSDLDLWDRYRDRSRLKISYQADTVFLGSAGAFLRTKVRVAAYPFPKKNDVGWDPASGTVAKDGLEDFDAVIHLAERAWFW